jgi:hypothetical protein
MQALNPRIERTIIKHARRRNSAACKPCYDSRPVMSATLEREHWNGPPPHVDDLRCGGGIDREGPERAKAEPQRRDPSRAPRT